MFKLEFLERENDLNKILKTVKTDFPGKFHILFVSLWDGWCNTLVHDLKKMYGDNEEGQTVYIVDSFNMPHSFVIHQTHKVPQLVTYNKSGHQTLDYLPLIRKVLLKEKMGTK